MAEPDDESMEGLCPQELGAIRIDMWRVKGVNEDHISEDENENKEENKEDEGEDEDEEDPKKQVVHERDAKAKSAEHRIMCVFTSYRSCKSQM